MKNRFRAAVSPSRSPSSSLISRIRWNRCTGLLFITERVSHLATKRSLVARGWRIETSLVNTKTVLFHHRTANIFLYFCVQGRATIHVQGRFNNDAVVCFAYSAIGYFSHLSSMIPARSGPFPLTSRAASLTEMRSCVFARFFAPGTYRTSLRSLYLSLNSPRLLSLVVREQDIRAITRPFTPS